MLFIWNNDEHLTLLIVMKDVHTKQTQDIVINMLQTQKITFEYLSTKMLGNNHVFIFRNELILLSLHKREEKKIPYSNEVMWSEVT